jgi:hypothetical protein
MQKRDKMRKQDRVTLSLITLAAGVLLVVVFTEDMRHFGRVRTPNILLLIFWVGVISYYSLRQNKNPN